MANGFRGSRLTNLKQQRQLANKTVQQLARESLTSDAIINNLENNGGNEEDWVIGRIAAALGVSRSTLGEQVL
jgi:transcriptional regulator with XRE-family HTH domain